MLVKEAPGIMHTCRILCNQMRHMCIILGMQRYCSVFCCRLARLCFTHDFQGCTNYIDIIMTKMASQITSLTVVYSTVYSDADQRKHQRSASLAFVWGIHRDRWIPRTKSQLRGKCFHLMTSSCHYHRADHICNLSEAILNIPNVDE